MVYLILRIILTFMRIPLVYGSSAPLDNILYHKNVPMIIQSLGSDGYLSLTYSLIAHSITLSSRGGAGFILEPQPISDQPVGLGFPHRPVRC